MSDDERTPSKASPATPAWGAGLAIGLGVGVALGTAMGNIGAGIGIGMGIGVAFAVAFGGAGKRRGGRHDEDPSGAAGYCPDAAS